MTRTVTSFCPGHISGYFRPVFGPDARSTGSMGAGIVIDEGVRVTAGLADLTRVTVDRVDLNDRVIERSGGSLPVEDLLTRMGAEAEIRTACRLPIGAGFGLSAAALTATAVAVNRLYDLGFSLEECIEHAHESEIRHHTGLGDVAASQGGGRDCRKGAGIEADIERCFDLFDPIFAVTFSSLPSPSILSSKTAMDQVVRAFPGRCPETPEEFFRFSRDFSEKSGLITPEVRFGLEECDREGILASMTMLGNGVFAYGEGAREILGQLGETFEVHVASSGVRILEES